MFISRARLTKSESLFVTFITCTFCTFISASLFSLRFMILVHGVHNTEQAAHEEERRRDAGTAGLMDATRPTGPAGGTGANMANVPNAPPTFFGSLYGKFYLSLVASMFVFSQLYIMPHSIQRVALYAFIVASCGLWLPQIYRNILRGTPKPLSATYIVGMSMSRMVSYSADAPSDHRPPFSTSVWRRQTYSHFMLAKHSLSRAYCFFGFSSSSWVCRRFWDRVSSYRQVYVLCLFLC